MTPLEAIAKETRHAFIIAKSDNVLTFGEILRISVDISRRVNVLQYLTDSEKKTVTIYLVKKGLDSVGGFEGMEAFLSVTAEQKKELFSVLSTALEFVPTKRLAIRLCKGSVAMSPQDQRVLDDALVFSELSLKHDTLVNTVPEKNFFPSMAELFYFKKCPPATSESVKTLPNETEA